jgi:integrase
LYWDFQFRNGQRKRVRVSKKLARVSKEFSTSHSVRHLADEILAPINRKQFQPESSLKISDYIEDFYFPSVENQLRPATIDAYRFAFSKVKDKLDTQLRNFRTVHAQRMLREIPVGRRTLIHIKAFLSAVFKHAKQEGVLDGQNPITDVSIPGRPVRFRGAAYSVSDTLGMLEAIEQEDLPEKEIRRRQTASDVIGVLSMTGLRQSECRGIRWSDWDESKRVLNVSRSVWGKHVGPVKTAASENAVPVIPLVESILARRRERIKPNPNDYVFAGERRGVPLNLHNLVVNVIKPALEKDGRVQWRGFHGFRRGLASNLLGMGVHPKLIQAILRHSDISTTLELYAMVPDNETREALEKLETKFNATGLIFKSNSSSTGKP